MAKSEHRIQDEIRLALSEHGVVLRLNSGKVDECGATSFNSMYWWICALFRGVRPELRMCYSSVTITHHLLSAKTIKANSVLNKSVFYR